MSIIDELLKSDEQNVAESLRVLAEIEVDTMPTVEEGAAFLAALAREFPLVSRYDDDSAALNAWLAAQKGSPGENVRMLRTATFIGTPEGRDPVAVARNAYLRVTSVVSRSLLLLRLRRDYLLGILELLRLRLTPAFGYLRIQAETAALVSLMADEPTIADAWHEAREEEEGKAFYKANQQRLTQRLKDLKLYEAYDQGSHIAQHSRILGVTPGLVIGRKSGRPGDATLSYQEVDDPRSLFLWLCNYLRTHAQLFQSLASGFPEVDFRSCSPDGFIKRARHLWRRMQQLGVG